MDIEGEEGNICVGNAVEPCLNVVVGSGCTSNSEVPNEGDVRHELDEINMDIEGEEGKVSGGNVAAHLLHVVAGNGYGSNSVQLPVGADAGQEPDKITTGIEGEEGKASVGNVAEHLFHGVTGTGCSSNSVQLPAETDVGQEPDVIQMESLEVQESTQISSDEQMLEQIGKSSSSNQENELQTMIRISQHNKPKKSNIAQVVPQDYMCTKEDVEIIEHMKASPGKKIMMDIDSAWVDRDDMECLFQGDMQLNGEVISAYIHCIRDEDHLLHREGGKVFLENTFISSLLKRDGDPAIKL